MTVHGVTFEYDGPDRLRSTLSLEIAFGMLDAWTPHNWPAVFAANMAIGALLAAAGRVGYQNGDDDATDLRWCDPMRHGGLPYPERQP